MAIMTHVSLGIANSATANSKDVTVGAALHFALCDVGRSYRLAIKLFGEDKPEDNLPATDSAGDDELYTFKFGFFQMSYESITVVAAGTQSFTVMRTISRAVLNEDSGYIVIPSAPEMTTIYRPRKDEVYAKLTLSLAPSPLTARSATIEGFY